MKIDIGEIKWFLLIGDIIFYEENAKDFTQKKTVRANKFIKVSAYKVNT